MCQNRLTFRWIGFVLEFRFRWCDFGIGDAGVGVCGAWFLMDNELGHLIGVQFGSNDFEKDARNIGNVRT